MKVRTPIALLRVADTCMPKRYVEVYYEDHFRGIRADLAAQAGSRRESYGAFNHCLRKGQQGALE